MLCLNIMIASLIEILSTFWKNADGKMKDITIKENFFRQTLKEDNSFTLSSFTNSLEPNLKINIKNENPVKESGIKFMIKNKGIQKKAFKSTINKKKKF